MNVNPRFQPDILELRLIQSGDVPLHWAIVVAAVVGAGGGVGGVGVVDVSSSK